MSIDVAKLRQCIADLDDSDYPDVLDTLPLLLDVYEAACVASDAFEQCGIEPHWNGYDKDQQRCVDAMEALKKLVEQTRSRLEPTLPDE